MIPVADLESIAEARLEDAKVLVAGGRYDGAVYLCGYAVEIALKARICKVLNWPSFPETGAEFTNYRSFQTHDLDVLLRLSGQEARVKQQYFSDWSTVAVWRPESRYRAIGSATLADGKTMLVSVEALLKII